MFDGLSNETVVFFAANTLYVISYALTSMFWLRLLAVIAALSTLPYFYFQPEPLWSAVFWQSTFFAVNFVNLMRLLYEKRKRHFSPEQRHIHESFFSDLKDHEVAPIFDHSVVRRVPAGETMLQHGKTNSTLLLIVSGRCSVQLGSRSVAVLDEGCFIGEMSFVSGAPVSADIITQEDCVFYEWDEAHLEKLFALQSLYKPYIYALCSKDMAEKLREMTHAPDRQLSSKTRTDSAMEPQFEGA